MKKGDTIRPPAHDLTAHPQGGIAFYTVRDITGKMYDEWFGGGEDKAAYKSVNSIFDTAYKSGNEEEFNMAVQFSRMLASMTETEKGAVEKYNKDDTWNKLGTAVDIRGLIAAFENLTAKLDDIQVTVGETS